ncbi:TetR/AcrR family transcriptional regulator [Amylibacter sp.]|jgi:AcrR family transcriptional regulator|nr:TetR/AcrR family transcriptional regulator [Amylibacter sp.]
METAETNPPKRKREPTQRLKGSPLNEADWIDAATGILVDENVRGIRIDALCKKLGVTKGSFYWHFSGRPALLAILLQNWRKRMTTNVIDRLGAQTVDPTARLRALLALPRRSRSPKFARIEQSIRDWGRRDTQARDAVQEVDVIRLNYLEELFEQQGFAPAVAKRRAYIAYAMLMGDSVLRDTLDPNGADAMLDDIMDLLTQKETAL